MKILTTYLSILVFTSHVLVPVTAYGIRASAERVMYFLAYQAEEALMEMAHINGGTYTPKLATGQNPRFSGITDFEDFCKYIWAPLVPDPPNPATPPQDASWKPSSTIDLGNKVLPGSNKFSDVSVGKIIKYVYAWVDRKTWNANKADKKAKLAAMIGSETDPAKITAIKESEAYKKLEQSSAIKPKLTGASDSAKLWPGGGGYYDINTNIGDIIGDAQKELDKLKALPENDPKRAQIKPEWEPMLKKGQSAAQAMVDLRVFDMDHPGKDSSGNQRTKGYRQEYLDKELATKTGKPDFKVAMKPLTFTAPDLGNLAELMTATQIDFDKTYTDHPDVPDIKDKVQAANLKYATDTTADGKPTQGANHMRAYHASKSTLAGAMNQPKPAPGCL